MNIKYNIYKRNFRLISYSLLACFMYNCAAPDFYTVEDVEKEKAKMEQGKTKSAKTLLSIYKDFKQPYDVRLEALRSLASSDLPFVVEEIKKTVSSGELIELDMMNQSINILLEYNDETATEDLIACLKVTESKIMDLRQNIVNAIGVNGSEDEVITLVALYEVSKSNHHRMNQILTERLGQIGNDKVIPVLMKITTDETLSINVRSQAVEILAKKNSTELVDYFIKVLDDPDSNNSLNRFSHMMFEEFDDPRMMMSILESYQVGKSEYYRLLNTLVDAMGNYESSEVKQALLDIAKTSDNPHHIRIKAINALSSIVDQNIVDEMLLMLQDKSNYKYYNEILGLINNLDSDNENINENLRKAAFRAMENHTGN